MSSINMQLELELEVKPNIITIQVIRTLGKKNISELKYFSQKLFGAKNISNKKNISDKNISGKNISDK